MQKNSFILFIVLFFILACNRNQEQQTVLATSHFMLSINKHGNLTTLQDRETGVFYIGGGKEAPFLSIRIDNTIISPTSMILDKELDELIFKYDLVNVEARVKAIACDSHLTFELVNIQPMDKVEMVIWGPYPTTINKSIGETVGIVRGEEFAIGLQTLNPKTLGGYPWKDNDCMPQIDIFENDNFSDLSEKGKRYVLYRVEAAKPEDFGSTLQAYCRKRSQDRIIENWGHEKYLAPAYEDGGVIGSKIALFGCPVDQSLDYIEKIEIEEGLPHPIIDGEWGKRSPTANASYLIMGFGEEDIYKAIEYTKMAGLKYLDHPGPFSSWGHFELNEQFPNGREGLKNCIDIAEGQGIHVGVHTLSNFINTNDLYVSPVPDERLAKVGFSEILSEIDDIQEEIEINSPDIFRNATNNSLKTVVIDKELIRYGGVSEEKPWRLLDCQRGAYNTVASNHKGGATIGLMADHAYKVFLTNADLTIEVAKNIADLFNQTGLRQISFDGLEGNRSTGMGNYGEILMTTTWYDNLDENIKSHFIADASRTSHYFWHIYSRMNWGEPWYAGFRESQTEYRFKNQAYFERNLMPGMLGWFLMTDQTSLEDIKWLLAKAGGYNAGFGLVSSYKAFEQNGLTKKILEQIKIWEQARLSGVFDETTREKLKNIQKEFHLEKINDNKWSLQEINLNKIEHSKKVRQPGEPVYSELTFTSSSAEQSCEFILTAVDGGLKEIKLEFDNYKEIIFPIKMREGDIIKYNGGSSAIVYNKNWQKINELKMESVVLSPGKHVVAIECEFQEEKDSKLKLEIRIPMEKITLNQIEEKQN